MATVQIDIPDALIPDLISALALRMQGSPDAAAAAVATKVLTGQPTTTSERQTLAHSFFKYEGKRALLDWKAQQAAQRARDDASDPAVTW